MTMPVQQNLSAFTTATSDMGYSAAGWFSSAATANVTDRQEEAWLGAVRSKFNQMFGQTDGWCGPGSLAIPAPLASLATQLLELFSQVGADRPSLCQDPEGGVSMEWLGSPSRAELNISAHGIEYWFRDENNRYIESTVSSRVDLIPLIRQVSK